MVDKSTDHGNQFINFLQYHWEFLNFNNIEYSWKIVRARKLERTRQHQFISIFRSPPISVPESFISYGYRKKFFRAILVYTKFFLQRRQSTQYVHELHWAVWNLLVQFLSNGTYLFFYELFRTHGFRRLKIHDKGSGSPVCFVEYQVHSLLAVFVLHRYLNLTEHFLIYSRVHCTVQRKFRSSDAQAHTNNPKSFEFVVVEINNQQGHPTGNFQKTDLKTTTKHE